LIEFNPSGGGDPEEIINTVASLTLDPISGWSAGNTVYTAVYDVADDQVTINGIDVRVSGARDPAGNVQPVYNESNVFNVRTDQANVTSVVLTPDPVNSGTVIAPGTATLAITYDRAMVDDGTSDPVVTFFTEDPTSPPATFASVNSAAWDNPGSGTSTVFTIVYNLADVEQARLDVDIRIDNAVDAINLQTQNQYENADEFVIDTEEPTLGIVIGDTDLTVGETTTLTFTFS
jgi:hypothetical protein